MKTNLPRLVLLTRLTTLTMLMLGVTTMAAAQGVQPTQATQPAEAAQAPQDHHAGVMKRGAHVMGFDQTTTTHHFRLTRTGGAIEVTANDAADTKAITQIQSHLPHIAAMFSEGNFSAPMLIHAQEPPGVPEMKRAGAAIAYKYEPLPRGGRVVLRTDKHLAAVHDFLRFQITDHKTGDPLDVTEEQR
jgi:hypothetical protein